MENHMLSVSNETVRRTVLAMDPKKVIEDRYGPRVARKLHGLFVSQPRADAPLNRVYIDHTQVDVYIRVRIGKRKPAKVRPWLTLVSDDHSGMPIGFAVSFKAPKAEDVLAALRNAILPKAYTQKWVGKSLSMVWESMGVLDEIVIDNGLDLQANAVNSALLALGISCTTMPPLEPWRRARAERMFGTLNTKVFHVLPGSTFGSTENKRKHEYDPQDFATLDFEDFLEALHVGFEAIACEYHRGIYDYPIRRWREGVRRFPVRVPTDRREFDAQLSLREPRVIGRLGIEYEGLFFTSEALNTLKSKLGTNKRVIVLVKPEDIRQLQVVDPTTQTTIVVDCTTRFDEPLPLFWHRLTKKRRRPLKDGAANGLGHNGGDESIEGIGDEAQGLRAGALAAVKARALKRVAEEDALDDGVAAQRVALEGRRAMENSPIAPDSKSASALIGRQLLARSQPMTNPQP
jgi:putative transposase